jgi:hypothetical protein
LSRREIHKANFERLKRAMLANQVALLECREGDKESLVVIVTVTDLGHDLVEFQPFAVLLDEPEFHESRLIARRRDDVHLN